MPEKENQVMKFEEKDALDEYEEFMRPCSRAGCAFPRGCVDCTGVALQPVDTQCVVAAPECQLDQTYLAVKIFRMFISFFLQNNECENQHGYYAQESKHVR